MRTPTSAMGLVIKSIVVLSIVLLCLLPNNVSGDTYFTSTRIHGTNCVPGKNYQTSELAQYTISGLINRYSFDLNFFCPLDNRTYASNYHSFYTGPGHYDYIAVIVHDPRTDGGDPYNVEVKLCYAPYSSEQYYKCSTPKYSSNFGWQLIYLNKPDEYNAWRSRAWIQGHLPKPYSSYYGKIYGYYNYSYYSQ